MATSTRVLAADPQGISDAATVLRAGGLVAFPTETVYGLGADALNARAVARIFEAKRRPAFDPLITHLVDRSAVVDLVGPLPSGAARLAARFWPGPLTLVVARPPAIPAIVTSGLDTLAVRVPDHPVARRLLAAAGVPVAAPSANRFGALSPTRAEHVLAELGGVVDAVLDGGRTRWGIESTVVDAREAVPSVLRLGAIPVEDLAAAAGEVTVAGGPAGRPATPGALPSHYAPRTPLRLVGRWPEVMTGGTAGRRRVAPRTVGARRGYLAFQRPPADAATLAEVAVLTPSGDLVEAAAALFETLRRLDGADLDEIVAETVPEAGLGRAINDRLRRAAAAGSRPAGAG